MNKAVALLLLIAASSAVAAKADAGCQVCFDVWRERGGITQELCDAVVDKLMLIYILAPEYGTPVTLAENITCGNFTDQHVYACGTASSTADAQAIGDSYEADFFGSIIILDVLNISNINDCNPPPYPQGGYLQMSSPCEGRDLFTYLPTETSCLRPSSPRSPVKHKPPPKKHPKKKPPPAKRPAPKRKLLAF